jgi:hypothetical protein
MREKVLPRLIEPEKKVTTGAKTSPEEESAPL